MTTCARSAGSSGSSATTKRPPIRCWGCTPCAANQPKTKLTGAAPKSMMGMEDGMMGEGEHPEDDHED